ncbi:uncharacterized protein METZ01_LOCUS470445, partial [marine metagenome]
MTIEIASSNSMRKVRLNLVCLLVFAVCFFLSLSIDSGAV